ncbi:hypothetical protein [Photorhabdus tasmaniensis]|uniref:Uncharacterized protein n=1 Tax=Photorhabdus tasmaniensis TaxID=1004159 RepID=A0ABX0GDL2_9GAMM|nr:hypothetical protein [Photorhabdus tasmaniensis]NHB87168.1 hypothetical protein [Photorhabdus tasmaniensis]
MNGTYKTKYKVGDTVIHGTRLVYSAQRLTTDSTLPESKSLSHIERADLHLTIVRRITDVLQYAGDNTPLSLSDVTAIFESFMKISTGENYKLVNIEG